MYTFLSMSIASGKPFFLRFFVCKHFARLIFKGRETKRTKRNNWQDSVSSCSKSSFASTTLFKDINPIVEIFLRSSSGHYQKGRDLQILFPWMEKEFRRMYSSCSWVNAEWKPATNTLVICRWDTTKLITLLSLRKTLTWRKPTRLWPKRFLADQPFVRWSSTKDPKWIRIGDPDSITRGSLRWRLTLEMILTFSSSSSFPCLRFSCIIIRFWHLVVSHIFKSSLPLHVAMERVSISAKWGRGTNPTIIFLFLFKFGIYLMEPLPWKMGKGGYIFPQSYSHSCK